MVTHSIMIQSLCGMDAKVLENSFLHTVQRHCAMMWLVHGMDQQMCFFQVVVRHLGILQVSVPVNHLGIFEAVVTVKPLGIAQVVVRHLGISQNVVRHFGSWNIPSCMTCQDKMADISKCISIFFNEKNE